MSDGPRIAIVGAGLIGRRHIEIAERLGYLAAIADPDPAASALADKAGVPRSSSLEHLIGTVRPDGVVIATPNQLHVEQGLLCVGAGIPMLIEKPFADTPQGAMRLIEASERAGVPILVGHHRRHNGLVQSAKREIERGG